MKRRCGERRARLREDVPAGRGRPRGKEKRRFGPGVIASGAVAAAIVGLLLVVAFSGAEAPVDGSSPEIRLVHIDAAIDSPMSSYVTRSIGSAEKDRARAVIIMLDTPGGFYDPTQDIIRKMADSPVPVIAYVAPPGARAAGAGALVLLSADVAAMAPGTGIDSGLPAGLGDGTDPGAGKIEGLAAYVGSRAEAGGRNSRWAEVAVLEPLSISSGEAVNRKVADMEAASLESLLGRVNGFNAAAKGRMVDTEGAILSNTEMNPREKLFHFMLNPNVAYVLLLAGLVALAWELGSPGIGPGAAAGPALLALALYPLLYLKISYTGLAVVTAGVFFMGTGAFMGRRRLFTAAGTIILIAGSLILFDSSAPFLEASLPLKITAAGGAGALFMSRRRRAARARRLPKTNSATAIKNPFSLHG